MSRRFAKMFVLALASVLPVAGDAEVAPTAVDLPPQRGAPATSSAEQLAAPDGAGFTCGSGPLKRIDARFAERIARDVGNLSAPTGGSGAFRPGIWWNALDGDESGWGIALQQRGDSIAGWWLALRVDAPPSCWLLNAQKTAPGVYSGDLVGKWDMRVGASGGSPGAATKAGTVRVTFADADNAKLEYTLPATGPDFAAMQSRTIARVSPGLGTVACPQGNCLSAAEACRLAAVLLSIGLPDCRLSQAAENAYQRDADVFRARYVIEWARQIEAFHGKTGRYPLQDRVRGDEVLLVQIATRQQQAYLDPRSPKYDPKIDNKTAAYTPVPVRDFVVEIERELGREIDERYDPQRFPYGPVPIYLSYVVHRNGYLIWAFCRTCPRRPDGFSIPAAGSTSTLNIGSRWFIESAPGIHSIESLLANAEFVEFIGRSPRSPWFEQLERAQAHDSKH